MNFYKAQGKMKSLLTGDIALETLEIAEDEYPNIKLDEDNTWEFARDIPPGEDIKWICGNCGATDWTPNEECCNECRN